MANLTKLPTYADDGALNVVVEAPRGASLKLEYDPKREVFTVSKSLPLGMCYPFDWGFVPSSVAEDGDPVDALVLHSAAGYPGVVLPCRLLGMVELEQKDERGKPEINNRMITTPAWHDALKELNDARDLPREVRHQLEQFFLSVGVLGGKKTKINGWANADKATRFLKKCLR